MEIVPVKRTDIKKVIMTIKEQKEKLKENELYPFTGTTAYYRYSPLFPYFILTDGTHYLAEKGECYWLMDKIAALQMHPTIKECRELQHIQFWKLVVHEDRSATLTCEKDDREVAYEESIKYTDFALNSVKIWVQRTRFPDNLKSWSYIAYLPSEY